MLDRESNVGAASSAAADAGYVAYHEKRIDMTLATLRRLGSRRIIEVGAHPWAMTARLIDSGEFEIAATVSAEEVTRWPDDIGVRRAPVRVLTPGGREVEVPGYSANVERTLFDIAERADTVLACEIVEHLIRAPHVMFLNFNRWLPVGGRVLVTTPNGAQFVNPLRRRSSTPGYRCNVYERHCYLYTREELVDLMTLCGFRVRETDYWDPYPRRGLPAIYGRLARLPSSYCREKFMSTIVAVGEKERDVAELERAPRVCDPRGDWERIAPNGAGR